MVDRISRSEVVTRAHRQSPTPGGFQQILSQQLQPVKFSRHAQQRLSQANRVLSPTEVSAVEQAVSKVAAKGARESLVLMNGLALLVSVSNRTVVTAVTEARMRDSVFTQIDSAIII